MSLKDGKQRHLSTSRNLERYNSDTWADEYAILSRPGERERQAALLYGYCTNVASQPTWEAWMRRHALATLAL